MKVFLGVIICILIGGTSVTAQSDPAYRIEFVTGANFPVAMAFAPDGRLFYTEKETGRVRVVSADGERQREPVIEVPTDAFIERGLLGITLDPNYTENGYIWIYHTQPNTIEPPYPINKVVRFREENGIGTDPIDMLAVPVVTREGHHNGGNLRFDETGYLYVSIGDYGDANFAQEITAMPGRIHRFAVVDDALVPAPDNPFEENSTLAYGLRNPFDFDFDLNGIDLIASENGPTCDDEINLIIPGGNYGWQPNYDCNATSGRFVSPIISYTPTEALTGVLVYDGEMFPEWYGDVFYCGWNRGRMWRGTFDEQRTRFADTHVMDLDGEICSTDVEIHPDGSIYFAAPDAIYRITREN